MEVEDVGEVIGMIGGDLLSQEVEEDQTETVIEVDLTDQGKNRAKFELNY